MRLTNERKEEQLLFDPDINKTLRQLRQRRKREQKSQLGEKTGGEIMAEEANGHVDPLYRRVLGDYALQQGPRHFSSIVAPNKARVIEIKSTHLTLVSANQFTGMEHEDPYTHLSTFYELTATMGFEDQDKYSAYMRLFPFSLTGKAKEWLKSHPNQSLTHWSDVQEKFLQRFFPPSRFIKGEIRDFKF